MAKPVLAYRPVIAFDVSILLLRVLWLNIFQTNTLFLGLASEVGANKVGAIITADFLWFSAPFDNLIQCPHYALRGERQINFHTQGFPVEVINQIENQKAASVR
ncbi:hypothetical protein KO536_04090 [Pseudomonas sp. NKUCC02_KPG]|nr:hypothetical protein [Pseudomonas sp. NKUCC02_KPG]